MPPLPAETSRQPRHPALSSRLDRSKWTPNGTSASHKRSARRSGLLLGRVRWVKVALAGVVVAAAASLVRQTSPCTRARSCNVQAWFPTASFVGLRRSQGGGVVDLRESSTAHTLTGRRMTVPFGKADGLVLAYLGGGRRLIHDGAPLPRRRLRNSPRWTHFWSPDPLTNIPARPAASVPSMLNGAHIDTDIFTSDGIDPYVLPVSSRGPYHRHPRRRGSAVLV